MHFNDDMGFGIVNAYSAVRLAETWQNTISDESSLLLSGLTDTIDSTTPEVSKILTITDNINVEHAVLKVNLTHGNMKQLTIEITSPGDITTSKLMETPNTGAVTNFEFEFSSVQFYGENSAGNWTVTITDNTPGSGNGILNSLELTVYGSAIDNNDQYIFTDEFAAVGTVSVDDVGADWINASAVTSDVVVDLSLPSSLMSFNSIDQDISALTAVANIITGDGNDILTGDDGSNILNGGRGDDTIIYANSLSDYTVDFTSPDYVLVTKNLSGIADTLYSIENLSFAGELYQTFISSPDEDTPITINNLSFVLDGLTVAVATAANGTVTINTDDGTLNYQGNLNFNGADVITYTLSNDTSGTINVTVVPVNDAPVAADDAAETISNATVTINVLDNDTDIDYDNLSIVSATAPNGVVTINADNTLEYTSNPDFSGTDTITYTVDDGNGGSDTASVTVTVSPINAIIKTDDTNYLHNLTLNYWKDGVDTGVSTLVENGAINFGQALDFDMVKLSSIAYDSSNINVSDAVAMKLHAATLEQIDPSILTIGSDPFNTVIDPNSIYWHAADLNNDGAIDVADAVAIERHYAFPDTDLINTFDLVDSVTFERITSLDVGATEVGNWTIVANGDATQDDGSWLSGYTVDIV
jgi:subtilisin-like proprotein convertase family protein